MDKQSLSKLTVVQLKKKLREEKLPVSGRKAVLVERLADYYQNKGSPSENVAFEETKNEPIKAKKKFKAPNPSPTSFSEVKPFDEIPTWAEILSTESHSIEPEPSQSLHFVLPIVGTKDSKDSLHELFSQGFISEDEYQQRLSTLDSNQFYSSSLCRNLQLLSLENNVEQLTTTNVTAMDRKKWSLAIKEERKEELKELCKQLTSALDSIQVTQLNLAKQEKLERICNMLQKIRSCHISYLPMSQIYTKITFLLSNLHDELFLVPLLQTISSLGAASVDARKILLGNTIDRLLQIAEDQLNKKYTMDVTIQVCKAMRNIIRSNNISILSTTQKTRLISFLMILCRNIHSHAEVLEHALFCLSIPCYGNLDLVMSESFFLETVYTHLSSTNLKIITGAVGVFVNVTAGSDDVVDQVIQMGVLDRIMAILRHYFLEESAAARLLVKECYFCLSNFGGGTKTQAETCMDRGVMPLLVSQYPEATKATKREMLWCLSNFMLSKSAPRYFDDEKLFLIALEMLQDPEVSDSDGEQLRKALHTAKKEILPSLGLDHPGIDNLLELLQ